MIKYVDVKTSISSLQRKEIIELVRDNAHQIGVNVFDKKTEFDAYFTLREIIKMNMRLDQLCSGTDESYYLIIATDEAEVICGYLLYQKEIGNPQNISISSVVVKEEHRGNGIMTNMIEHLKTISDSIILSCFPEKVPMYKKLGFKVYGSMQTQVDMVYNTDNFSGKIVSIDDDYIDQLPEVRIELNKVKTLYGDKFGAIALKCKKDTDAKIKMASEIAQKNA